MTIIIAKKNRSMTFLRTLKCVLFFFLFSGLNSVIYSQSISGVVNDYTEVTAIGSDFVEVSNATDFQVGDKALLIQMKGASITTGNVSTFGTITSQNNAGNFEFVNISQINGSQIIFANDLCQAYDFSGLVQLVRVPVYSDAEITSTLTASPWNGSTGGVLVIEATNSISLNANIDLKGIGFRGGQITVGGFSCSDPNWANNNGGEKGEGVAVAPSGQNENRAPLANGGGGSNTGNPGAGGGGNAGTGGRGGNEWFGSCTLNSSFGVGGFDLDYSGDKAFLGGGGGGGYKDNGLNCTPGSNGGGIAIIIAPSIEGNGFTVDVSGADVIGNSDSEGAGAGGAGGCAYLVAQNINSQLDINAQGGKGGDIFSTLWQSACHGPGGGGGGGAIVLSFGAVPLFLNTNLSGGNSGSVLHNGPACTGTPHGAVGGTDGLLLLDYDPPVTIIPDLGPDFVLCSGDTSILSLGSIFPSYLWSDGSSSPEISITSPGIYWVEISSDCGFVRDSIEVLESSFTLDLGIDVSLCSGSQYTINMPPGFNSQLWSTGSTLSSIDVSSEDQYYVDGINMDGCSLSDSINVSLVPIINTMLIDSACQNIGIDFNGLMIFASGVYEDTLQNIFGCDSIVTLEYNSIDLPIFSIGDTVVCQQDSVSINLDPNYTYNWFSSNNTDVLGSNGAFILAPQQSETFTVTAQDVNGCEFSTNTEFTIEPLPLIEITSSLTEICEGQQIDLSVSGGVNYNWSGIGIQNPDAENHSIVLNVPSIYYVSGESDFGCVDSSSINILVNEAPVLTITPDQEICRGEYVEINVLGANYYQWQNSDVIDITSPQIVVSPLQSELYQVIGFNNLNCTDTVETNVILYPVVQAQFTANPTLLTSDSPLVNINNTSINSLSSTWSYGDGNIEENNQLNFDYQYPYSENNYILSLLVVSNDGCQDSVSTVIQVKGGDLFYIPNSFTPDGDEFNNSFLPVFTVGFDPANYLCSIYNRWGELIFQSSNHKEGWDGTYNGVYSVDGLYSYIIKYKNPDLDEYKLVTGHVNLFR